MTRERPILFSAPMVRAILSGAKTQTRRLVRSPGGWSPNELPFAGLVDHGGAIGLQAYFGPERFGTRCPYGVSGDRLWVRETWFAEELDRHGDRIGPHGRIGIQYQATPMPKCRSGYYFDRPEGFDLKRPVHGGIGNQDGVWRPSIFMPRAFSRITLEVTEVRVQRLQEISEYDARAEGVETWPDHDHTDVEAFRRLWESINGKRAPWASNPWVWCVSFRRVEEKSNAA